MVSRVTKGRSILMPPNFDQQPAVVTGPQPPRGVGRDRLNKCRLDSDQPPAEETSQPSHKRMDAAKERIKGGIGKDN